MPDRIGQSFMHFVRQLATAGFALSMLVAFPGTGLPQAAQLLLQLLATFLRLRVPDGETLSFDDGHFGSQQAVVGRDFGDFLVWRKDDTPSYQLACVVDDAAMGVTEVVRGADLILSTFRQLLLYRAVGYTTPAFYHCPLMVDEDGVRLAKRHDALSLRTLRESGKTPQDILKEFNVELRNAGTEN